MRKKRKNPAADNELLPSLIEQVADVAGNLSVTNALRGCSMHEKLLIAAFIPILIKVIRTTPENKVEEAVAKLYPAPEPEPQ